MNDYLFSLILLLIGICIIFKINIFIFIIILILIILYYDIEIYLINYEPIFNKSTINICSNPFTAHYGDHIFNSYFLNHIQNYIENNNIIINYYIDKRYHNDMKKFIISKNIIIKDYKPLGYHLNIVGLHTSNGYKKCYFEYNYNRKKCIFDKMYKEYFNEVSNKLNIPIIINEFLNIDDRLLIEYEKLEDKFKNLDIFIINSKPRGNQYIVNYNIWDKFVIKLFDNNFKIATTKKVLDINCTLDNNLSLFEIGAISTHSKIIIGINTGPISTIFNIYTLNFVKKIFLFDNNVTYSYNKIQNYNNPFEINIDELKLLLN